ncbi:MAG: hypothetical protein GX547_16010 [Phycisphaerae bacterium]|nr:hypothetical protein [Phycisphaerae bacterium]
MPDQRLLIDNDAFLRLSGAGVLERAVQQLGFAREQVLRLPSLPYMIQKSKSLQKRYAPALLARASANCPLIHPITNQPDAELMARLSNNPQVDGGEVLLYGLLVEHPLYLLASNDKRAMRALASDPRLIDIRDAVAGRVICLERIIRQFLGIHGQDATARFFQPVLDCDIMLQVVLSPATVAVPGRCALALDAYLADLKRSVGEGFLYEGP